MFSKLLVFTVLAVSALAAPAEHHEATSFAHYNDNHNSVQHIQSAPQAYYHKAAPQPYHAPAPQHQLHHAPAAPQPQVYHVSQPQVYHAAQPQVYHAAQPQVSYHHAPQQQVYHQAPQPQAHHQYAYSVPAKLAVPVVAAKVAIPVAKVAPHYAPVTKYVSGPVYHQKYEEQYPDAHPKYEYAYLVEDGHTGDFHSQQEQRDGDHVVGQYSLHEADGTVRIVKYSDEGHGFNAVVERQGHPTEAPQHQYKKVVVPVVAKVAAPQYQHHY